MPAPRWLARFNLYVTNRILGPLASRLPGMGVVLHVGRKTGRLYRTPVLIFRRGDRLIIALTYGRQSQWSKTCWLMVAASWKPKAAGYDFRILISSMTKRVAPCPTSSGSCYGYSTCPISLSLRLPRPMHLNDLCLNVPTRSEPA